MPIFSAPKTRQFLQWRRESLSLSSLYCWLYSNPTVPFSIMYVLGWTEDRDGENQICAETLLQFQSRTEHPQTESWAVRAWHCPGWQQRGLLRIQQKVLLASTAPADHGAQQHLSAHFNCARQLAAGVSWRYSSSSLIYFGSWLGMQEANEHRNGSGLPCFTSSPTPPTHLHSSAPVAIHLSTTAAIHTNELPAGAPFLLSRL